MDATHFVLLCAVFVLVSTWMLTSVAWGDSPAPGALAGAGRAGVTAGAGILTKSIGKGQQIDATPRGQD